MADYTVLTDANFAEKTAKGKWLVDMWAAWCGPCKMVGPIIEKLAAEYKGKINVGKMDVDSNQEMPGNFEVMSIPTLLFIKDGVLIAKEIGAKPEESLKADIKKHLGV